MILFWRMNLVVYIFFHRFWIMLVRRLSIGNLFCLQVHFSYKEVLDLLILVHLKKTPFKMAEFIKSVRGTHISRAIIFRALAGIFPLIALFLFSSIIVWYISHGNPCWKLKLVSDVASFICLRLGWLSNASKIFSKSVLFREFSGFHAGIFNFVMFTK